MTQKGITMYILKLYITFLEDLLGSNPVVKEAFENYIMTKRKPIDPEEADLLPLPDNVLAKMLRRQFGATDVDDIEEEDLNKDPSERTKREKEVDKEDYTRGITVFLREEAGSTIPILLNYLMLGFLKEALLAMGEEDDTIISSAKVQKALGLNKYQVKRTVDRHIFSYPRKIKLNIPEGKGIELCTRTLRGDVKGVERITVVTSESVPAGTTCECEIHIHRNDLLEPVLQAFKYGQLKGLGQWRNSSKGRFDFEVEVIKPEKSPLDLSTIKFRGEKPELKTEIVVKDKPAKGKKGKKAKAEEEEVEAES